MNERDDKTASLISLLQKLQGSFGYLPEEALEEVAKELKIPLSGVYGVATFYTQFRFTPLGKYVVRICHGTACHVTGSENISQALEQDLGIKEGETTKDGLITLERVACLGCCSLAPTVMINDKVYGRMTHDKMRRMLKQMRGGKL
jgi:NADH-quinone oxidoreductase subunit E